MAENIEPLSLLAIESHLVSELDDVLLARTFAKIVFSDVLQWRPPLVPPGEVRTIVAYSFGNRTDANGNRSPGPVNEALADVALRLHQETGAPVFAQWEIASAIGDRISVSNLTSITPLRNSQAETIYLSTGGVATAVIQRIGDATMLGKVAVVAFRDHIKRCVDTSRSAGLDAAAPAGYGMPKTYDVESGQPWTRTRLAYLMHDLRCRFEDRRDQLNAGA